MNFKEIIMATPDEACKGNDVLGFEHPALHHDPLQHGSSAGQAALQIRRVAVPSRDGKLSQQRIHRPETIAQSSRIRFPVHLTVIEIEHATLRASNQQPGIVAIRPPVATDLEAFVELV